MMNKMKTLLGNKNMDTIFIGLIKYSILFLLMQFMPPWVVGTIWVIVALCAMLFVLYKEAIDEDGQVDGGALCIAIVCFCFPLGVLQSVIYYFTFHYIGWFGIPALSIANMLLWMFILGDNEPRTKTTSSNETISEEATCNDEDDPVDGEAQDVPACDLRPDSDGDTEDKNGLEFTREEWKETGLEFTRDEWEEAKKVMDGLDKVISNFKQKLDEAGYDPEKTIECSHLVKKYSGEPIEEKDG